MKKITAEEAGKLLLKLDGRGMYVRAGLFSLKPGEYLVIERKDWTWKTQTPKTYVRKFQKKYSMKFDCKHIADGSGWLIKRIA